MEVHVLTRFPQETRRIGSKSTPLVSDTQEPGQGAEARTRQRRGDPDSATPSPKRQSRGYDV